VAGFPVLIEPPVLARDASGSFSSRSLTRRTVSRLNLFAHIMGMLPVRTARPGHGVRLQLNPERSGTIGCAVAYRTPGPRRNIFLTCRHTLTEGENGPVPAAPDELVILRRNPYRKRRVLGSVSAFKWDDPSARSLDVALINVGNDIPNVLYTPRGISRLTKEPIGVDAALRSRCTVQKVGFKTNYSLGRVMGLFRLRVRSADGRSHVYKRVFEIWRDHPARPFCDRQDSGSVAWTYPTVPGGLAQPVGMICATSKGPLLGYAVPMADIVNDLDVEVRID
jgi:hypothetical protein